MFARMSILKIVSFLEKYKRSVGKGQKKAKKNPAKVVGQGQNKKQTL